MKIIVSLAFTVIAVVGLGSPALALADCTAAVKCTGTSSAVFIKGADDCDKSDCLVCVGTVCPIE